MGLVVKRERFGLELKYDVPISSKSKLNRGKELVRSEGAAPS